MNIYRFVFQGPMDWQISDQCGSTVTSTQPTPAVTKDITVNGPSDLAPLAEGMKYYGWAYLEEVP
jgi:hypothetical protein